MYLSSKKQNELLITKKYATETYGIFVKNELVLIAMVAHNRTNLDIGSIFKEIYEDIKREESTHFMLK